MKSGDYNKPEEILFATYDGLLAASRASLNLLRACPVDERRRCL